MFWGYSYYPKFQNPKYITYDFLVIISLYFHIYMITFKIILRAPILFFLLGNPIFGQSFVKVFQKNQAFVEKTQNV